MPAVLTEYSRQRRLEAYLRNRYDAFLYKAFRTVSPGAELKWNWHIGLMAEYLEACRRREITRLVINIPPRTLKPLDVDTPVACSDGTYRRLGDIRKGDRVLTHCGRYRRVTAVHEQGELETLRIVTHSGRVVIAAPDHPFLTPHGWVEAGKLKVGDVLGLAVPQEDCGEAGRAVEEYRLAGYFIGDGNVCEHVKQDGYISLAANIACHDKLEMEDISHCASVLGWTLRITCNGTRANLSGGAREWLRKEGIAGKNSYTKNVPDFVAKGNLTRIAHFIGAYFDCDGTISQKNLHNTTLSMTSVSRELLEGVQHLLTRLGIYSRLRRRENRSVKSIWQPLGYVHYELAIGNCNDVERFARLIPLHGIKRKRLAKKIKRRTDFDHSLLPDLVTSIEPNGKRPCRCLSVEEDHSFTASDIVVHNSIATTVAWPAFLLGKNPSTQIIAASYSAALSTKHSIDTRLIVESEWYRRIFPEVQLVKDQNTKTKFVTTKRGHRFATSVGTSTATGEGGDFLIVDDPLNPMQALSEADRPAANDWFDQTFVSRLNSQETGVIVVVMQRLHMEDLTGHLLKRGGWENLCVPLIAPEDKVYDFGRVRKEVKKGECLHPERFPSKVIEDLKRNLGSYAFAGQYLQSPTPLEGGFIKKAWLERYRTLPANPKLIVQSWDTAMKADQLHDPSGCQTFYVTDRSYYVADYYSERLEYPDLKRAVKAQAEKWKPHAILIEDKGSGESLIQDLRRESQLPVIPCLPESDKVTRLAAQAAKVEAGLLFLPENAQWLVDYEVELVNFPNAPHDEVPDTLSQFLKWIGDREGGQYRIRRL